MLLRCSKNQSSPASRKRRYANFLERKIIVPNWNKSTQCMENLATKNPLFAAGATTHQLESHYNKNNNVLSTVLVRFIIYFQLQPSLFSHSIIHRVTIQNLPDDCEWVVLLRIYCHIFYQSSTDLTTIQANKHVPIWVPILRLWCRCRGSKWTTKSLQCSGSCSLIVINELNHIVAFVFLVTEQS